MNGKCFVSLKFPLFFKKWFGPPTGDFDANQTDDVPSNWLRSKVKQNSKILGFETSEPPESIVP